MILNKAGRYSWTLLEPRKHWTLQSATLFDYKFNNTVDFFVLRCTTKIDVDKE